MRGQNDEMTPNRTQLARNAFDAFDAFETAEGQFVTLFGREWPCDRAKPDSEVSRFGTLEGLPSWGGLLMPTPRLSSALYPARSPRQLCFPKPVAESVQFD